MSRNVDINENQRKVRAASSSSDRNSEKTGEAMKSWEYAFAVLDQRQEQKRVISERKLQARTLTGGCVLIRFPKVKSE